MDIIHFKKSQASATCLKASGKAFMKQSIINNSADSLFWKHLWIDCKNKQTKRGEKSQLTTGPIEENRPNELLCIIILPAIERILVKYIA